MSTLHEINQKAQRALRSALDPVEYARYHQQFSTGSGDYTAERQQVTENDAATVSQRVAEIKAAGLLHPPAQAIILKLEDR